jgi:hypothetical protein
METETEIIWTPEQVSEFLNVSMNTLRLWRSRRKNRARPPLPYYKPHGTNFVRYRRADVYAFLESGATQPGEGKRKKRRGKK